MKKLILLIAVVVTASISALAQDISPIQLGIKAGANMTKISGESFSNAYNLNYLLGGYLTINLSKTIGIQPELEFSQVSATTTSGFNALYGDFGTSIAQNPHLDYMTIPVLLNIGGSVLKLQVGPQFSELMNSDESFWANGKAAFSGGDIGMDGGLWINLPLHLNAFARYVIGLDNINNLDNRDTWKSQQIQLGVGFRL